MSTPPDPRSDAAETGDAGPASTAAQADATATNQPAAGPRRRGLLLLIGAGVLALDIGSKQIVVATLSDREPVRLLGGFLYLTEARNTGAAFSFAPGATMVFTIIALVVVAVVLRTSPRIHSTGWAIALGLILGGAAGNLADRLFRSPGPLRGAVIDFLSVLDPYGRFYPIFNLADSAICCGGVLAVLLAFRGLDLDGVRGAKR